MALAAAPEKAATRPVWLKVRWEKTGEGTPCEPVKARMQASIHVKVVGLLVNKRDHVSVFLVSALYHTSLPTGRREKRW